MQVEQFLTRSAQRYPEKTALVAGGTRLRYRELDRLSNRLAHRLEERGVQRGDRVAIYLENTAEAVISIFGALKAGAVFLVVNPGTKADKLAYILNNCRAVALISDVKHGDTLEAVAGQAPSLRFLVVDSGAEKPWSSSLLPTLEWRESLEGLPASADRPPPQRGIDIDLATIIYTSGSTGFPKGVMMTHLNVVTAATSITQYLENTPDDIVLSVLPLSFDYGLYQALMTILIGMTLVLEKSFAYPAVVLEKLEQERVTGFPIIPTVAAILLQMKGRAPGRFPGLRYMTNTAAALPPAHIERLQALFPKTRIFSMYGLTECKRVSYLPPEQLKHRPQSVGKAIPNTEVYVLDDRGERVGPGVVGELVVRGAHVMKGYWEKPEETARVLKPGPLPQEMVLHTGDLFRTDEEGYLYFVGRKDDIIKTRGEKVSPKEVEAVLHSLPGVAEAVVTGVPDEVLGQAIQAVIVPADGATLTAGQVMAHCAQNLEPFMVPKFVEFRSSLPQTSTGKVSRRELGASAGKSRE